MSETTLESYNNYLRVAAHLITIILLPILVYFNSELRSQGSRLTSIEAKMDIRSEMRKDQIDLLNRLIQDHEARLRIVERDSKTALN